MFTPLNALAGALHLRAGEGRTLSVLGGFLLLNTANTTLLSSVKNGLFLSEYPAELIPYAIIAAALLTALTAITFAGVIAGTARRSLAVRLTAVLTASVLACWALFRADPRTAFIIYLWISAVQVLVITHAWDYASDLLTGRQAKRLLPLIGMGASVGAILGGAAVAPAAVRWGTEALLLASVVLLLGALPFLWWVPEPQREEDEETVDLGAVHAFVTGAARGFRALANEKLLRLLAAGLVALTLTGTLIDLQLKIALQESFTRDRITAIYGLMSTAVGIGTLLVQFWASRVLLPKLGVSFAAMLQAGALAFASAGAAVAGGVGALAGLQVLDDVLQHSLQKPVEQVSLLPFPGKVKSAAVATLGGVLRPLSKAAAGAFALALATRAELLPLLTVLCALAAFAVYSRHRATYMAALESALARHAVDLTGHGDTPLQVGREALDVIDRALRDDEPTVVIFATSLLSQLPRSDAAPRAAAMLSHPVPEVRAEAASVLAQVEHDDDDFAAVAITERLKDERDPAVLAALLDAAGSVPGVRPGDVRPWLEHPDAEVRRAAWVALGRIGVDVTDELRSGLSADDAAVRAAAARAIGDLGRTDLMDELASTIDEVSVRPAVLDALARLGAPAVPVMQALLARRDVPLATRRRVVSALASIPARPAREALVSMLDEPALGPAALTSLQRQRSQNDEMEPVDSERIAGVLDTEVGRGLRYTLIASGLRARPDATDPRVAFVADELHGLRRRSTLRILRALTLSYDPTRMRAVADAILSDDPARRSNALELLEGSISAETAKRVMPFMEAAADDFPEGRAVDLVERSVELLREPTRALLAETDWWPRALGLHLEGRDDEITVPGESADDAPVSASSTEDGMIPLIEKVMILKGSELFSSFPGPELAGVAALTEVVHLDADEVLFERGEEGDAFYMVVSGAVRITRGARELAMLGPREGFGEMAILDREARSATATAAEPTTLLRIDQASFDQLIERNPAVARGIYRVLTRRLRSTLAQVAAG